MSPDQPEQTAIIEAPLPYPRAVAEHPRVRQTLLSSFDRCGLSASFYLSYERGHSSHDQARGQLFHRTAARSLETMAAVDSDSIPVAEALAIMEEVCRQAGVDELCPHCGAVGEVEPGIGDDGRRDCGACGERFTSDFVALPLEQVAQLRMSTITWAHNNTFDIQNLGDVEQRLTADVTYPGPAGPVHRTVTGALDCVFFEPGDKAVVVDWKDTWALPPESEVSFGGYFQQRFYGLLVLENYPSVQSVTLREFYVRYSEPREATVHRADIEDLRQEIAQLVERFDRAVEESLWRPSAGSHCSFCPLPERCTIISRARGEGMIETDEDARRVAAELVVADAVRLKHRKALKAYATRTGRPTPVADAKGRKAFGFVETVKTLKPDPEALEQELREAGYDPRRVRVEKLYRKQKSTTFKLMVPPDEERPTPEDARVAELLRASIERSQG